MSAAAIPIYKMLIAKGVGEEEARQAAEEAVTQAVDVRLSENLQAAKTHADQAVVKSEEKADAKFVSQARFHELDKHVATTRRHRRTPRRNRRTPPGNQIHQPHRNWTAGRNLHSRRQARHRRLNLMSAAAIPIYKMLIARGVSEEEARQAAEEAVAQAADVRLSENLQAAKTHADQAVVKSEEKADAKFVSQARFHELDKHVATRGDIAKLENRMREDMAELRAEIREDMAKLEKRMEDGFAENRAEMAELRREIKFNNRIGIGLLAAIFILAAKLVIGV